MINVDSVQANRGMEAGGGLGGRREKSVWEKDKTRTVGRRGGGKWRKGKREEGEGLKNGKREK